MILFLLSLFFLLLIFIILLLLLLLILIDTIYNQELTLLSRIIIIIIIVVIILSNHLINDYSSLACSLIFPQKLFIFCHVKPCSTNFAPINFLLYSFDTNSHLDFTFLHLHFYKSAVIKLQCLSEC